MNTLWLQKQISWEEVLKARREVEKWERLMRQAQKVEHRKIEKDLKAKYSK
jgi:hypothetical protein